jgi:N-acetylmuramoyl-L-alanine amidase
LLARLGPLLFALISLSLLSPSPTALAQAGDDPRFFSQTRYRIENDRFWDYFQKRGGVSTFGYPISSTFPLLGHDVQIFQRQVMQARPDGSVATLNLLDKELMPYTEINGSDVPGLDESLQRKAPDPEDKSYHAQALQFVKDNAPDVWEGQQVNFYSTFMNTVPLEAAFPNGGGDRNLLAGLNLEIWGLPTSKPTYDPSNAGFVYQRFQRGIMHYDSACGCTQGLLLGLYFKSIITLLDLPSDLANQARDSRFFGQLKLGANAQLSRPKDLPQTDLSNAFLLTEAQSRQLEAQARGPDRSQVRPPAAPAPEVPASQATESPAAQRSSSQPLVVVDAGHGGKEIGASHTFPDGLVLAEKHLTLKVAQRLGQLLEEMGYAVILTRNADRMVNEPPRDLTGDDKLTLADELQARIDLANKANADLLISVHFNGAPNASARGTQIFYNEDRPFSDRGRSLAELIQTNLIRTLAEAGYQTQDRKAATDSSILGSDGDFYLLGPRTETIKRPSNMPGVIGEALYLTNQEDASALRQDKIIEALARGYADAIKQYFQKYPPR